MKTKYIFISLIMSLIAASATAQTDTLLLDSALVRVLRSHPSLLEAQEAVNVAESQVSIAKSAYLPTVTGSASYTRVAPVSEIPFGGVVFKMNPENNYNLSVNYSQILYDFGKTSHSVDFEKSNKSVIEQNMETLKQKLAMNTISTYYTLAYLDKVISIKDEEIKSLENHLHFIEVKTKTGSATQFDILSTKIKISNIQSQKIDLLSTRSIQQAQLNNLLGKSVDSQIAISYSFLTKLKTASLPDSLVSYAYQHRNELTVISKQMEMNSLQVRIAESQNNPVLAVFANAGAKNGYPVNLNEIKPNIAAGVSFTMPLFDGFRKRSSIQIAHSRTNTLNYQLDNTKRNITNEVVNAQMLVRSNLTKIDQYKLQVEQSDEAVKLATVSYEAGAITNLELLDAEINLAESKLMLVKSQIDYQISLTALDLAIGNRLY
jgi:outer membrane protein TolC